MMQSAFPGIGGFVGQQLATGTVGGWVAAGACACAVLVLACTGLWLAATDIREHRLPRTVVWPLYPVLAVLLTAAAVASHEYVRVWWMLWGLALMGGVFVLLRLIHPPGMGLGDVRLSGVLGLATGFASVSHTVIALWLTFVLAGLVCAVLIVARRMSTDARIAFGPFMIVGSLAVLAFG